MVNSVPSDTLGVTAPVPDRSSGRSSVRMEVDVSKLTWTPPVKSGARDAMYGPLKDYCPDRYSVERRKTRTVGSSGSGSGCGSSSGGSSSAHLWPWQC